MLIWKTGNLFDSGADILVNTVNCKGVMGKGIALEFKKRYPQMYQQYKKSCALGYFVPGGVEIWDDRKTTVINIATKDDWRKGSQYVWIAKGLVHIHSYLLSRPKLSIAIPAMGCNNGGLKWDKVKMMIACVLKGLPNKIYVYQPME